MTRSIEQCLSPFHVHSTLLSTRITNSRLKGNKWLKEPVIRQLWLQTSTNATYPYCLNIHSPLLHYITLFPLDAVVGQWIYLLLWLLSHIYTRPRSHMSQWTCIITLTLKNTSALLTASCIPSYFNSMCLLIYITGQYHTCTLLLNNTFYNLIIIWFWSTWVCSETQLDNLREVWACFRYGYIPRWGHA